MELSGKKINFLGDSITEGCGTSSVEHCFTNMLKRELQLAEARNYGIGGTRIAPQRVPSEDATWDLDFCNRYSEMDCDADVVVVFGGTNDFGHGDAPLGCANDSTPDSFFGACDYLYKGLRQKFPCASIVVITPLHRIGEDSAAGDGNKVNGALLFQYVDAIREVAKRYGFPVLELFDFEKNPSASQLSMNLLPDGLHPNDQGHVILTKLLADFLMAL